MKLIFDLGANTGGNLEYYLKKARVVVAVEANEELCKMIQSKFANQIDSGKLVLINACLTLNDNEEFVNFYLHKYETVLSRFTPPKINPKDYKKVFVPSTTYQRLVGVYGLPDFVKIDLEGFDRYILNYLVENNLLPKYLSFENQGLEILKTIINSGNYKSFNILPFYNYATFYDKTSEHTAGPMGRDIKSPWLGKDNLLKLYRKIPHSWVDIHLTENDLVDDDTIDYSYYVYNPSLLEKLKRLIPMGLKSMLKRLMKNGS